MKKYPFFKNTPAEFKRVLERVRNADEAGEHSLIAAQAALYAHFVNDISRDAPELGGYTLENAIDYYVSGGVSDADLNMLVSAAARVCEGLCLSAVRYGVVVLSAAFLALTGRDCAAHTVFAAVMGPIVYVHRYRYTLTERGKKGGRPDHKHKARALELARELRSKQPAITQYRLTQIITGQLAVDFNDAPSYRSVETWMKQLLAKKQHHN